METLGFEEGFFLFFFPLFFWGRKILQLEMFSLSISFAFAASLSTRGSPPEAEGESKASEMEWVRESSEHMEHAHAGQSLGKLSCAMRTVEKWKNKTWFGEGGNAQQPEGKLSLMRARLSEKSRRPVASPGSEKSQQQTQVMPRGFPSPRAGVTLVGDACSALLKTASAVSSLPGMRRLTFLSLKRKPLSLLKITEDGKGKINFLDFFLSQRNSRL